MRRVWLIIMTVAVFWLPLDALAQSIPGVLVEPTENGGQQWSLSLQTLLFLTSLTFLPAVILMMTCFVRLIIVFGLLRTAMGTQSAPPNQVLLGLALFLTFFIMAPVFNQIYYIAWLPFSQDNIDFPQFLELASGPLREFMLAQTREPDLALLANLADVGPIATPQDVPFHVLVPSFVTSELKTAFQIDR